MQNVSVAQTLKRYYLVAILPLLLIFFGCFISAILSVVYFGQPIWALVAGLIAGLVLGGLYYYRALTKWRLWAYSNVSDLHELCASQDAFPQLSLDDSIVNFSIITTDEKAKMNAIKMQLREPYQFIDDHEIPDSWVVSFSKPKKYVLLGLYFFCTCTCLYIYQLFHQPFWLLLLVIVCVQGALLVRKTASLAPQIIISNKGIQTHNTSFKLWSDIWDVKVDLIGGRSGTYFFSFKFNEGEERMRINMLDINRFDLSHLLYVYKRRSMSVQS